MNNSIKKRRNKVNQHVSKTGPSYKVKIKAIWSYLSCSVVTFRDLQKLIQSQSGPEHNELCKDKKTNLPGFGTRKQHKERDIKTKGDCCFNHIKGSPRKDGIEKPIFDYEKLLYDSLLISEFYINSVFLSSLNPFCF